MILRRIAPPFFAVCTLWGLRAHAQTEASPADRAAAESLFVDGKRLMSEGHIAEACRAFAESQRLDAGGGTLFALAFCHEREGKTASAWLEFKEALAVARRDGRHDREQLSQEHIAALEPRLAYLTLRVGTRAPELAIRIDGAVVGDAAWGAAIPVDPGAHTVEATAPGARPWSKAIAVAERASVNVDVPPLSIETRTPPLVSASAPPADPGRTQRIAGYAVGGVGVAMIGAGAFFGVRAVILKNRSDGACDATTCTEKGLSDYEDSRRASHLANIGLGAGLAALAGGVIFVLTAPRAPVRIAPSVGSSGGGFVVDGRF